MKNKKIIIIGVIIVLIFFTGYVGHINKVSGLKDAIEIANEPTKIEQLKTELSHNRIERIELQKDIDEMQKKIDIEIWKKQKKAERADKIQEEMKRELGL